VVAVFGMPRRTSNRPTRVCQVPISIRLSSTPSMTGTGLPGRDRELGAQPAERCAGAIEILPRPARAHVRASSSSGYGSLGRRTSAPNAWASTAVHKPIAALRQPLVADDSCLADRRAAHSPMRQRASPARPQQQ
jgi:hypothetical protein